MQQPERKGGALELAPGIARAPSPAMNAFASELENSGSAEVKFTDKVRALDFFRDEPSVAVVATGAEVFLVDVVSGVTLGCLAGGSSGDIRSVRVTPDGTRIVSGSEDGTIVVWNVTTRAPLGTLVGHKGHVRGIAVTSDSKQIVSGAFDTTVRIWDAESFACLAELKGHTGKILAVSLSPDDAHIFSAANDHSVIVWKRSGVSSADPVATLRGGMHICSGVTPLGTDRVVTTSFDYKARVWSLSGEEKAVLKGHTAGVVSVATSPDGAFIVTGSGDRTVRIWNAETYEEVAALPHRHANGINAVAFSPDNRYILTGSSDKTVRVWRMEQPYANRSVRMPTGGTFIAVSPDGQHVAVAGNKGIGIRVIDLSTNEEVARLKGHEEVGECNIAFTPDGKHLVSPSAYVDTGHPMADVDEGHKYSIRVWDWTKPKHYEKAVRLCGHSAPVANLAVSPDGILVASGAHDNTARVWNWRTGKEVCCFRKHSARVSSVGFSADSHVLVTGSDDRSVRIWDLETKEELASLTGLNIAALDITPNGQLLLVVGRWDLYAVSMENYTMVGHLGKAHKHGATAVTAIDDHFAASGSHDHYVHVWDLESFALVACFPDHTGRVWSVAAPRDGRFLASSAKDGTIRVRAPLPPKTSIPTMFPHALSAFAAASGDEPGPATSTLLHKAARDPLMANSVATLLKRGRDRNHGTHTLYPLDGNGMTALDVAIDSHNESTVWHIVDDILAHDDFRSRAVLVRALPALACNMPDVAADALHRCTPVTHTDGDVGTGVPFIRLTASGKRPGPILLGSRVSRPFHFWTQRLGLQAPGAAASSAEGGVVIAEAAVVQLPGLAACSVREGLRHKTATLVKAVDPEFHAQWSEAGGGTAVDAVLAIPAFGSDKIRRSLLQVITEKERIEIVDAPVVQMLIDFRWTKFARAMFFRQFVSYVLFTALFTFTILWAHGRATPTCNGVGVGDSSGTIFDVACHVVLLVATVRYLCVEATQLRESGPTTYLSNVWNLLDISAYIGVVLIIGLRFSCKHDREETDAVASVTTVLLWLKLLEFARGFEGPGTFVRIMFRVIKEIRHFMTVLIVCVGGYAIGMHLLFRNAGASEFSGDYRDFRSFFATYTMLLGEVDLQQFGEASYPALAYAFFLSYTLFSTVVLLNLLVALMSNVFEVVRQNSHSEWLIERAKIVVEKEKELDWETRCDNDVFPMWLQVLRPVKRTCRPTGLQAIEQRVDSIAADVKEFKSLLTCRT